MDADFPLTSPCVGVCQINAKTKFCLGCFRTLREVAHWSRYDDDQKREVLLALRERQDEASRSAACDAAPSTAFEQRYRKLKAASFPL